ncbi:MAG: hypothetical protein WC609_00735 [Candidatus Paceibacterota bacterium]|jgi:hypothetical protein
MKFEGPSQKIPDREKAHAIANEVNRTVDFNKEVGQETTEQILENAGEFAKIEYETRERAKSMSDMELREESAKATIIAKALLSAEREREGQK